MENWYGVVDEISESAYIKWKSGQVRTITFLRREPNIRMGRTKDGQEMKFFDWPVALHENGARKEKILSTASRRLLQALKSQDQKASLEGKSFAIKAVGDGFLRVWDVVEVSV